MILAGDVGGTKVNLALFRVEQGVPHPVTERSYTSRDYPDLTRLIEEFLKAHRPEITHACLGVAGPVQDGRSQITHLPWTVDVRELKPLLKTESVSLINDLAALAYAIPYLPAADVATIQTGSSDANSAMAVLSAGTGLGQAFLIPQDEGRYRALETEGGQCDFAPRSELEISLHDSIRRELGRVAIEDVLSGPGLVRLYQFFKERAQEPEPAELTAEFQSQDPASVISRNGLSGKSRACREALAAFVSVYGAVAGNLVLQMVARGGVYLGGGIAPEILPLLKTEAFLEPFRDKGEFREFMSQIPVQVILNKSAPLLGAAYFALGETRVQ